MLERGVGRGLPVLPISQPEALAPAPLAGKVEEAQTIEGAPALKHGTDENPEKEFSALFCIVYLAKQYLKLAGTTATENILMNQTNPHKKGTLALAHLVCFSGDEHLIDQGVLITEVYNILIFRPRYLSISALKFGFVRFV